MSRRAPTPLADALELLQARLAPATTLARAQSAWTPIVGPLIAANTTPTAEREGILMVSCAASVWAQELELMRPELIDRINARLGPGTIRDLRLRAL
jgi:predicted nucleic acid-binding Zn ribbon protein